MGIETEYGITVQGVTEFNPVLTSSVLINSYVASALRRVRWDYEEESPLRDARGFETVVPAEAPSDEELGLANVILTNGARYYVDHAHPEYSTPECTNPRDLVIHDKAGERILELSIARATQAMPTGQRVLVYKNNTDNKGVSYGTHENYLVDRAVPFPRIVRDITPHFVSRQIYTGAGLLGGHDDIPYQISQRADFFEVEVGLETTLKRPIVNTRDEPHADPEKYRRLHVIIGDANMSEVSTYLKLGTTSLVLAMIEDKFVDADLALEAPVAELRAISHDPSCRHLVILRDGRRMTGVQLQMEYLERARKYTEDKFGTDVDEMTADVLDRWESVLTRLAEDPMQAAGELDWVAKLELLEGYRTRDGLSWNHPRLQLVDLQYSDVRPERGLYNRLVARGRMRRLVPEAEVTQAVENPPDDTRAYFRGRCLQKYPDAVAAASWDSVIFDIPGHDSLQRVPTLEPLRGTRAHVGDLIDRSRTATDLVAALTGNG